MSPARDYLDREALGRYTPVGRQPRRQQPRHQHRLRRSPPTHQPAAFLTCQVSPASPCDQALAAAARDTSDGHRITPTPYIPLDSIGSWVSGLITLNL